MDDKQADNPAVPPNGKDAKLRQIKVLISSTRADLMQYREAATRVLNELQSTFRERLQVVPIGMETEDLDGGDARPVAKSKEWVEASDWVILIVGRHYGTITDEEGTNGLSVTEWEYRHARALKKKVFVFLSGPKGSSDPYDGMGDTENLPNWTDVQTDAQAAGLKAFRKELESGVATLFRNARHFEQRLFRTLTRAVINLPPDLTGALRDLVIRLLPKIKPCYQGVKQLYRSKDIHDAIHVLRQQALIDLRARVERKQKGETVGLAEPVKEANKRLGIVTAKSRELESDKESNDLQRAIDRMEEELNELRATDPTTDQPLPAADVAEQLDKCFSRFEQAFDAANAAMQRRKTVFAELHSVMTWALETEKSKLKPADQATLQGEIDLTNTNHERLLTTLETHDDWQRVHREIVLATGAKKNRVVTWRKCVEREAKLLKDSIAKIRAQAQQDEDDITELEKKFDELTEAQQRLLRLPETVSEADYVEAWHNGFCKTFDECFFQVDKRTLTIVTLAKERVEEMEESFKRAGIDQ